MPDRIFKPFAGLIGSITGTVAAIGLSELNHIVSIAAGAAAFVYTCVCIRKAITNKQPANEK